LGVAGQPAELGAERIGEISAEDFDALVDALDAEKPPPRPPKTTEETEPAAAPSEGAAVVQDRRLADALSDVAKQGLGGADESLTALYKALSGGKVTSGLGFDEESYQRARPHIKAALEHFISAGKSLREALVIVRDFIVKATGATKAVAGEYLKRFKRDLDAGVVDLAGAKTKKPAQPREEGTAYQADYEPASAVEAIGTLVPANMQTVVHDALAALKARVGDIDAFVTERLEYKPGEIQEKGYFAAEQMDALALAIDNMDKGAALVLGDQTGVGKGRVVAGVLRYAMKTGRVPIFVTEKPNLYKDIIRDFTDIGMSSVKPFMTDNSRKVPLDDDETVFLRSPPKPKNEAAMRKMMREKDLGEYDLIFTTYSQLQLIANQETVRRAFISQFARGGFIVFDESHNAGGTGEEKVGKGGQIIVDRAALAAIKRGEKPVITVANTMGSFTKYVEKAGLTVGEGRHPRSALDGEPGRRVGRSRERKDRLPAARPGADQEASRQDSDPGFVVASAP